MLGGPRSERGLDCVVDCRGMAGRQRLSWIDKRVKQRRRMVELLIWQMINSRVKVVASGRHVRVVRFPIGPILIVLRRSSGCSERSRNIQCGQLLSAQYRRLAAGYAKKASVVRDH